MIMKLGNRNVMTNKQEISRIGAYLINEGRVRNAKDLNRELEQHKYLFRNCDPDLIKDVINKKIEE